MRKNHKRSDPVNPTLKEMILGILLWGVLLAAGLTWAFSSKGAFLFSLGAGVLAGVGMAVHMYVTIEEALELPQKNAQRHMQKGAALRMLTVVLLVLAVWRLHGSIPGVFLGVFTLKLGAYTQPFLHKILEKRK